MRPTAKTVMRQIMHRTVYFFTIFIRPIFVQSCISLYFYAVFTFNFFPTFASSIDVLVCLIG